MIGRHLPLSPVSTFRRGVATLSDVSQVHVMISRELPSMRFLGSQPAGDVDSGTGPKDTFDESAQV